ncbi:hypothetical protein N7517_009776 [Penicillium concentricum]|uniref:Uncharacterized protein n=1 Tax=Penicillium concentricum TaxID=293559 RepID=A0A9W9RJA1_9EURO|nr:uncharacterized protein N7517_009776 [Penicillium concentricum]KAJ5360585.1 hypothetical protein N7517_009776 [Penicillium concentricum]
MLGLTAVIAIAACGAAIFIAVSVVSIIVWVRYRKERHAIRLLGFTQRQGRRNRGLQSFPEDTLTELSRAEGSILRAHGHLPYGKPTEWGHLTSSESLHRRKNDSESSFPFTEKARSLRNSLSRSRSKRLSRASHKRVSSLATLGELSESIHLPSPPPKASISISKADVPLSAVEGILELPAESTPRQTPEPNEGDAGFHLGMKPVSSGWPLPVRERSSQLPVSDDRNSSGPFDSTMTFEESPTRLRGGSIASQTAGMMPGHSIPPPPPTAYPPDRFSYARNDSVMRLSSMSLDTTNSSILDDGRNGSADTDLTSPTFPSGTFVPFSAADVGVKDGRRSFIATNTSILPMHNFPVRSSSTTENRQKSASLSPRRSLTTHHLGTFRDRFTAPRRSDSMASSNSPSRHPSQSGTSVGYWGYQNSAPSDWRSSGSHMPYVSHVNQFQNSTGYQNDLMENDPFYVGSPGGGTLFHQVRSPGKAATTINPRTPMRRDSLSLKGTLPSALKGGNSKRKGHRRQNCVRISIHPPMTFGSSTFSPTVEEEPEDFDKMEEVDLREVSINNPTKSLPSLPPRTTSPLSSSRRSKYGSRHGKPGLGLSSLGPLVEEPQPPIYDDSPCKKKSRAPSVMPNNKLPFENNRALPELFTSLPLSHGSLAHTPSPERVPPAWRLSDTPFASHENSPGSPRRSAVKGPRSQPGVTATRNQSTRAPSSSDYAQDSPLTSPSRLPLVMSITGTEGSDWRRSTESLQRTKTDASNRSISRARDSMSSLDNGLGPIGGASALYGNRRSAMVQDRVTIFEDPMRTTSPHKTSVLPPTGSFRTPESSPTRGKNSRPRSMPNNQRLPPHMSSHHAPPTPTSPRRGMTTPTGKALGVGVGNATPASLYDGDGFLRE